MCVMTAGAICAHKDLHVGPTLAAMATKFRLGAEIQSAVAYRLVLWSVCSLNMLEGLKETHQVAVCDRRTCCSCFL